jgi:dihydrofolate synthase/folylpolyglutamate synthase
MAEDIETFGFLIDEDCVRRGIAEAKWPGRFEVIAGTPFVIVDSAHTLESARACVAAFKALFPGKKYVLLFGISADKDIPAVARELGGSALSVVVTQADHPRAAVLTSEEAISLFPSVEVKNIKDAKEAFDHARSMAAEEGVVLAAGSVFLAGQVRRYVSI